MKSPENHFVRELYYLSLLVLSIEWKCTCFQVYMMPMTLINDSDQSVTISDV